MREVSEGIILSDRGVRAFFEGSRVRARGSVPSPRGWVMSTGGAMIRAGNGVGVGAGIGIGAGIHGQVACGFCCEQAADDLVGAARGDAPVIASILTFAAASFPDIQGH